MFDQASGSRHADALLRRNLGCITDGGGENLQGLFAVVAFVDDRDIRSQRAESWRSICNW